MRVPMKGPRLSLEPLQMDEYSFILLFDVLEEKQCTFLVNTVALIPCELALRR